MKTKTNRRGGAAVLAALCLMPAAARAVPATIDFGVSWPTTGDSAYSAAPYDRVIFIEAGLHSNETAIATLMNTALNTTIYTAGLVNKTDMGGASEIGGPDGYFLVPSGWNYLVVQYDGPNGGSVVVNLGGNEAKVPFDSASIWSNGRSTDSYAVTHYSVIGQGSVDPRKVPDGGATLTLLGLALGGMALAKRCAKR